MLSFTSNLTIITNIVCTSKLSYDGFNVLDIYNFCFNFTQISKNHQLDNNLKNINIL